MQQPPLTLFYMYIFLLTSHVSFFLPFRSSLDSPTHQRSLQISHLHRQHNTLYQHLQ